MLKLHTSCALGGFRYGYGFGGMSSLLYDMVLLKKTLIARNHSHSSPNNGPKNLKEALSSFETMLRLRPLPRVVGFNQLLHQISLMKHYSAVISLYKQMDLLGIKPDLYTLNILINCFCLLNHLGFALSVF